MMKTRKLFLVIVLVLFTSLSARAHGTSSSYFQDPPSDYIDRNMTTLTWKHFGSLDDNAKCDILYMEAPVSKSSKGNKFAAVQQLHGGIGFVCNGRIIIYEYNAGHGVANAVLPFADEQGKLVFDKNGGLVWRNEGIMEMIFHKDMDGYWIRETPLGTVSGAEFKRILDYMARYVVLYPRYILFTVRSRDGNGGQVNTEQSSTCVDFVFNLFKFMTTELGICLEAPSRLKKPMRAFVVAQDTQKENELSVDDPKVRADIQDWFTKFTRKMKAKNPFALLQEEDNIDPYLAYHKARTYVTRRGRELKFEVKKRTPGVVLSTLEKVSRVLNKAKIGTVNALSRVGVFERALEHMHGRFYTYVSPKRVQLLRFRKFSFPITYEYRVARGLFNDENPNCMKKFL